METRESQLMPECSTLELSSDPLVTLPLQSKKQSLRGGIKGKPYACRLSLSLLF